MPIHHCKKKPTTQTLARKVRHSQKGTNTLGSVTQRPNQSRYTCTGLFKTKEVSANTEPESSCLKGHIPLKVALPPTKEECDTSKLLSMDHPDDELGSSTKKLLGSDITTDNNLDKSTTAGISVEEFECGVSVAGSEKQEWSFTLYDFDGRGNITKDDLATLLKSLYDAVGSSIKLPRTGAKTMKLRLSVTPDGAKIQGEPEGIKAECKDNRHRDSNNLKHMKNHDNSKLTTKETIKQNNLSAAMEKLNVQVSVSQSSPDSTKNHHRQVRNNLSPRNAESTPVTMTMTERQQLAELVQQNMDRHRRRQHHLRRHNSDVQASRPNHHHHSRSGRTERSPTKAHRSSKPEGPTYQESQERRNYYLDLAGIDSSLTKQHNGPKHNDSAPAAMLASPRTPRRSHHHHGTPKYRSKANYAKRASNHCGDLHQSRLRSHDVVKQVLTEQDFEAVDNQFDKVVESKVEKDVLGGVGQQLAVPHTPEVNALGSPYCSPEKSPTSPILPRSASTPKTHKLRPISLPAHIPETVSPHHHRRHRHRERNRKMAMQQVAEWIEREHSSSSWASCGTEHVVVQKHEHHHVHEHHHHHHYHHYQET